MCSDNTISKDDKTNYETKSFKVIEASGYDDSVVFDTILTIDLDILSMYALKGLLLTKNNLGLFSRVLKGTANTQLEEDI